MVKAFIEISSNIIVLITVVDFIVDCLTGENIVSAIRLMIRQNNNNIEFAKSQKRVTYISLLCKALSLALLVFSALWLNLLWTELMLYMLAISIFIANITVLVSKAINN